MSEGVEPAPISGEVRNYPPTWIQFQTDDKGRLHIRTLYKSKVIEDPSQGEEIIKALRDLTGL